jgi:hypothetical protein
MDGSGHGRVVFDLPVLECLFSLFKGGRSIVLANMSSPKDDENSSEPDSDPLRHALFLLPWTITTCSSKNLQSGLQDSASWISF